MPQVVEAESRVFCCVLKRLTNPAQTAMIYSASRASERRDTLITFIPLTGFLGLFPLAC
jgi:hypothetical protein